MFAPFKSGFAFAWLAGHLCLAPPARAAASAALPPHVLVLDSYHHGFPWSDRLEAAIAAGWSGMAPEVFVEYMDTKRFPARVQEALLGEVLERKYGNLRFQAIIAADDNAYQFMLRCGQALFGATPVVFCGVNDFGFDQLKDHPNITGIVQTADVHDTLTVAWTLTPGADRVVFIHDDSSTGRGYRASFERDFVRFLQEHAGTAVRFIAGCDLTTAELLNEARSFRRTDIVLLSRWFEDKAGEFSSEEAFVPRLSACSPVPIWGLVGIGTGTVGGRLVTPESQGSAAAQMASLILAGAAPSSTPVRVSGTNLYTFDWQQLRRWNLDIGRLPRGSVIVNQPSSVYHTYRRSFWFGSALVLAQAVLIFLLVVGRATRRRAEARLRDSERRLKLVTEGVSLGVFDWHSSSPMVVLNRPLAAILELDAAAGDTFAARRLLRALERRDRHTLLRRVWRCLHANARSFDCECRLGGPTEPVRCVSIQGTVADLNGSGCIRVVGMVMDITDRRQAGELQLRLERELQEARKYESLGVLAGGLAHDFNNLLQPVIGNASMLEEEVPDDSPLRPLLRDIITSGRTASELAQKLLAYAGQAPTVPRQIDAARLVERLSETLKAGVPPDRRLSFEASAASVPAFVDVAQYRQILMSLLANAVEATGPGGRISVRVAAVHCVAGQLRNLQSRRELPSGSYARITVEDDGEGIAPERIGHVFDPFFTTRFLGRGLGLSAVAGIVHRHGGALSVTSELGHGSRFEVHLPAFDPAASALAPGETGSPA